MQVFCEYLLIKILASELIDNLEDEMHRVCDFCGIDKEDNMFLNINERWGKATSQEVDKYDRELILSIARNEMEKYGYL